MTDTRSMRGPKFCSTKITQHVRAAAEAGMEEKAREFGDPRREIHVAELPGS